MAVLVPLSLCLFPIDYNNRPVFIYVCHLNSVCVCEGGRVDFSAIQLM